MKRKIMISIASLVIFVVCIIIIMIYLNGKQEKNLERNEQSRETALGQSNEITIEQSNRTATEQSNEITIEQSNGTVTEQSNEVIIEDSFENYAWGFQYTGTLICRDGTMYEFNITDYSSIEDLNLEERYKFILENSDKKDEKLNNNDINDIIKYSENIDYSKYSENNFAQDMGNHCIYVILNNEKNKIYSSGDWNGIIEDENAEKLLTILEKY